MKRSFHPDFFFFKLSKPFLRSSISDSRYSQKIFSPKRKEGEAKEAYHPGSKGCLSAI